MWQRSKRASARRQGRCTWKVIDHLDAGACRWLSASPLMFAAFGSSDGIAVSLAGGEPGFAGVPGTGRLRLPIALMDRPALARVGCGFGALSLVPTLGETLRINGRVAAVGDHAIEIKVEECYIHCAKALIRSDFWSARPRSAPSDVRKFLADSRFIALGTIDVEGRADLSPKGDPAGAMVRISDGVAWFADRPGNRRADSFRNILTQPRVAATVLLPGAMRIAVLFGSASLTTDDAMRGNFAVDGKTPRLMTCIDHPSLTLEDSPALERARLWPAKSPAMTIDPAAIIVGHVKLSKERGLQAALVRTVISAPGLMRKGLEHDYKTNLY